MNTLAFDTATPATAVALLLDGRGITEARDDPPAGAHPGHATRLLALADELLDAAGAAWRDLDAIAVGTGPGGFTGLRVGIATAHGLAASLRCRLSGISSLEALAAGALGEGSWPAALAVIDARRGEVFAALYERSGDGAPIRASAVRAVAPDAVTPPPPGTAVVGDGALRYRAALTFAGCELPDAAGPHLVRASAVALLAQREPAGAVLPEYVRRPDAELEAAR